MEDLIYMIRTFKILNDGFIKKYLNEEENTKLNSGKKKQYPSFRKRFNYAIHVLFPTTDFQYEIHHFKDQDDLDSVILIPKSYEDNLHNFIHNRLKGNKTSLTSEQFREKYKDAYVYTLKLNPQWQQLSAVEFLEDQNLL